MQIYLQTGTYIGTNFWYQFLYPIPKTLWVLAIHLPIGRFLLITDTKRCGRLICKLSFFSVCRWEGTFVTAPTRLSLPTRRLPCGSARRSWPAGPLTPTHGSTNRHIGFCPSTFTKAQNRRLWTRNEMPFLSFLNQINAEFYIFYFYNH